MNALSDEFISHAMSTQLSEPPGSSAARSTLLGTEPGRSETRTRVRAMQLQAATSALPWLMVANITALAAVCIAFSTTASWLVLGFWALLTTGCLAWWVPAWLAERRGEGLQRVGRDVLHRVTGMTVAFSLAWALPSVWFAGEAGFGQLLVLAAAVIAMIAVGSYALASLRQAGTALPLLFGLGGVAAIVVSPQSQLWPLAVLIAVQAFGAMVSTRLAARNFKRRVVAELRSEQQHQVIGLLLRDFEEQTADVLWEVDAAGRLRRVSGRLARMLGRGATGLNGREFADLLGRRQRTLPEALRAEGADALRNLKLHLAGHQPFRDLTIPIQAGKRTLWWSLTAKPVGLGGVWRGVASNVTAVRETQRHVWQLAHFDGITGLSNRHQFRVELETVLESVRRHGGQCAVLCLDLDGFKTVNDALGHDMGDKLLRVVGQRLEAVRRKGDIVARLGGDEFGIIIRDTTDVDEVALVAGRVLYALGKPCEIGGVTVPVAASLGVAMAPQDGVESELLLKHADLALYAAKGAGRNQYQFYTSAMGAKVMKRLSLERALRDAIPQKQLHMQYQPQLQLSTGRIIGCEALLRWRHPELGEIGPAEFIPVAEEAGMIAEIGRWVLHEACSAARSWPHSMRVSVNLSPLQIVARDIRSDVAHALAETGLEARRLEIEITESVLLNDSPQTLSKLHDLRELGVRIALDDFGTGYASLAYLRRFPFDQLKIDQAFVREIVDRPDARAIVHAAIAMARALRMDTLAEGVEDERAMRLLRDQQCESVQGYLVSPPISADAMRTFIKEWTEETIDG